MAQQDTVVSEGDDAAAAAATGKEEILALLHVRSEPLIQDPRELHTILTCSLRSLFGSWEPYSGQVINVRTVDDGDDDNDQILVVQCPQACVKYVQAALTMVTLPAYMEDDDDDNQVVYRLDVVNIILHRMDKTGEGRK